MEKGSVACEAVTLMRADERAPAPLPHIVDYANYLNVRSFLKPVKANRNVLVTIFCKQKRRHCL